MKELSIRDYELYSLWEQSLAVILFALSFALMKMIYALLVLRLFLAKV